MAGVSELTIIVKDEEKTLKSKHLIYDDYTVSPNDPILARYIKEAVDQFSGEPSDVKIKISMTL